MPDSYKSGIEYIEGLSPEATVKWLEKEIREKEHRLAGDAMSQPVQAIIDHYNYLSPKSKAKVRDAIEFLVIFWKTGLTRFSTKAIRHLLSIIGELHVVSVMRMLMRKAESSETIRPRSIRGAILRAIANNAVKGDEEACAFWERIAVDHPEYAGMAFQVLCKIDVESALRLLRDFPQTRSAVGSVARSIDSFILEQPHRKRLRLVARVEGALCRWQPYLAKIVQDVLDSEVHKITN